MSGIVNTGDEGLAAKNQSLGLSFNLVKRGRGLVWRAEGLLDVRKVGSKETGVPVQPKLGVRIETGLLVKGSRATRWSERGAPGRV